MLQIKDINNHLDKCLELSILDLDSQNLNPIQQSGILYYNFIFLNKLLEIISYLNEILKSAKKLETFIIEKEFQIAYPNLTPIQSLEIEVEKMNMEYLSKEKLLKLTEEKLKEWEEKCKNLSSNQLDFFQGVLPIEENEN